MSTVWLEKEVQLSHVCNEVTSCSTKEVV